MNPNQNKTENTPLGKRVEGTKNLMPIAALTLMCYLRDEIGYHIVAPQWLWGVTVFEIVISVIFPNGGRSTALFIYAVGALILGLFQRFKRYRQIQRSEPHNSVYLGTSRLRFAWMPCWLLRNRRVERYLDSICCFILGTILLFILPGLGFWIITCSACLRVLEADVYTRELDQKLHTVNGLLHSQVLSEVVGNFEGAASQTQQPAESTVDTGLGNDLRHKLNRRKK